jgi:hypothetical protein
MFVELLRRARISGIRRARIYGTDRKPCQKRVSLKEQLWMLIDVSIKASSKDGLIVT